MRTRGAWALLAAALCAAAPALAVLPTDQAKDTGRRFGRASRALSLPTVGDALKGKAVRDFNARHRGGAGRLGTAGVRGAVAPADVHAAATSFLSETQSSLGIDPQQLEMLRTTAGEGGHRHVLYRQLYKGLPVDFSSVKVHFDGSGQVLDVNSNFRRNIDLDVRPDVAASVAAYTVKKDLGEDVRSKAELVVMLDPVGGAPRLAWKLKAEKGGRWVYYVDAHSGELVFRYDDRRSASCALGDAEGMIRAVLYPYDQQHGALTAVPMADEYVYNARTHERATTNSSGQFCFPGNGTDVGKIYTFLQGPNVRVGNSKGSSAFYTNGSATWSQLSFGANSPAPYPNNADDKKFVDVNAGGANPNVLAVEPLFNSFQVGVVSAGSAGEAADITDDDQVAVLDGTGTPVGFYVGTKTAFTGVPVAGTQYTLELRSNDGGTGNGYTVANTNALTLSNAATNGSAGTLNPGAGPATGTNGSFDWVPTSFTTTGLRAEMAAFYHLNTVHDWFASGVDASGVAPLTPISAMVLLGPDIVNAFYDPEYDVMAFGDHSSAAPDDDFTDDATVAHHEYTHFVVQRIWNIQNFGEAGAISEGNADYFSATSLAPTGSAAYQSSSIGKAVNEALGNVGPLRELDSTAHPPLIKLGYPAGSCGTNCTVQAWTGEIHTDSIYFSQALWDLRRTVINTRLKPATCADQLVFQALLFFPESFQEFVEALEHANAIGAAPACGGAVTNSDITTAFGNHGIFGNAGGVDPYDTALRHNDGFESAVDISTIGPVTATIFPTADIDFYTFAAGPGKVTVVLGLPQEGTYYSGYMLTLYDKNHNQVAQAMPALDGVNTNFGLCTQSDCTSTQSEVTLTYMNPTAGQLFVEVSGGPSDQGGSNSGVYNANPYVLSASFSRPYSLTGGIVSAQLDKDTLNFSVQVTTWTTFQDYRFGYAQLRDQAQTAVPNTDAPAQTAGTKYLVFLTSANALGQITGTVQLANGFNARFPALGTVYLEVFGYNVSGSTVSLGLSNPINLTTNLSDVRAWNNVFNPRLGQKTTVRYDLQSAGHLTMRLYTLNGSLVQTLYDGDAPSGKGSVDWAGQNGSGATVASGIYLLHIQGPGISKTQKIAVIK